MYDVKVDVLDFKNVTKMYYNKTIGEGYGRVNKILHLLLSKPCPLWTLVASMSILR